MNGDIAVAASITGDEFFHNEEVAHDWRND
jgi:hypothetical protein